MNDANPFTDMMAGYVQAVRAAFAAAGAIISNEHAALIACQMHASVMAAMAADSSRRTAAPEIKLVWPEKPK